MNDAGKTMYEKYTNFLLEEQGVDCDLWEDLSQGDQQIWQSLADEYILKGEKQ